MDMHLIPVLGILALLVLFFFSKRHTKANTSQLRVRFHGDATVRRELVLRITALADAHHHTWQETAEGALLIDSPSMSFIDELGALPLPHPPLKIEVDRIA